MATAANNPSQNKPWYEAYPQPSVKTPDQLSKEELLSWIQEGKRAGKDYLVVDVRRDDHNGGFLRGSLNLPIESLYPALSTLYELSKNAGVGTVIFYCVTSRGRGNRAAAWFADFLREKKDSSTHSVALTDGILGWALGGSDYDQHIDEFVPEAWKASDAGNHAGQLR